MTTLSNIVDVGAEINGIIAGYFSAGNGHHDAVWRRHGCIAIELYPHITYVIKTPVVVPDEINLGIISKCRWSAAIQNDTSEAYPITVMGKGNVGHVFEMRDVALLDGGVRVEGLRRGRTALQRVKITGAPDYCVDIVGRDSDELGPTNYEIDDCDLTESSGGVRVQARSQANGDITKTRFIGMSGTSVYIDAPGVDIRDNCDFMGCSGDAFIHLGGDIERSSLSRIHNNRFGNESAAGHNPPKTAILIGEPNAPSSLATGGYDIQANWFRGSRRGLPQMQHSITITNRANGCNINRNHFFNNVSGIKYSHPSPAIQSSATKNILQGTTGAVIDNSNGWDL